MLYPISIQMCIVHGEQNSRHWNKYQDVIYFLFSNSEFLSWYIMKYYKKLLITNYNYWSKSVCQSSVRVFCQSSVTLSESSVSVFCLSLSVCLSLSEYVSVFCQSVWVCQCRLSVSESVSQSESVRVFWQSLSESVSVFCQSVWVCQSVSVFCQCLLSVCQSLSVCLSLSITKNY